MFTKRKLHQALTYFIAVVWLLFGLVCKVLNFVPRHQQIVGRILGEEYAFVLTKMIGSGEVLIAVWVLSGISPRLCAIVQIVLVLTMNFIEFFLVPDILLFGKLNLLVAFLFSGLVYYHTFVLKKEITV